MGYDINNTCFSILFLLFFLYLLTYYFTYNQHRYPLYSFFFYGNPVQSPVLRRSSFSLLIFGHISFELFVDWVNFNWLIYEVLCMKWLRDSILYCKTVSSHSWRPFRIEELFQNILGLLNRPRL